MSNNLELRRNIKILGIAIVAAFLAACSVEDPSLAEFDLMKIRFIKDTSMVMGTAPFKAYFTKPELYTNADNQADLFYALSNGDTMKVSICEYENTTLAEAFFYNHSIAEKDERLIGSDRKRFFRWGRRIFIFSYQFSISQNSSILDSILFFIKRFPAADTSINAGFHSFPLKNSCTDKDFSVQRTYFLGIEAPFNMLVHHYRDRDFSWVCARSSGTISEKDWEDYKTRWQNNVYGQDSTALISRLSNGIVAAVYGDLDKERMKSVFKEFTALVK
jgi:hypothetical protein